MANYIKVTKKVADKIGAPVENRNKTADGNILLWQADLNIIPGETIEARAAFVGGVVMSGSTARGELDGTAEPAKVSVPEYYQDVVTEDTSDEDHPVTLPAGEENGENVTDGETDKTE